MPKRTVDYVFDLIGSLPEDQKRIDKRELMKLMDMKISRSHQIQGQYIDFMLRNGFIEQSEIEPEDFIILRDRSR